MKNNKILEKGKELDYISQIFDRLEKIEDKFLHHKNLKKYIKEKIEKYDLLTDFIIKKKYEK